MKTARKITLEVPRELLAKAQCASGTGVTQTVRAGLQLVAASRTYGRLRRLRGRVRLSRTAAELKTDRSGLARAPRRGRRSGLARAPRRGRRSGLARAPRRGHQ